MPDPSHSEVPFLPGNTPPSALRSAFWRYYDRLGRLTLLSAAWSVSLGLVGYFAAKSWPSGAAWPIRVSLGAAVLVLLSMLTAGFGRWVFGVFVEGSIDRRLWVLGARRFTLRVFLLALVVGSLTGLSVNALVLYLHLARTGSLWGWVPAFLAATLLTALLLSCVWHLPVLFFRDDPAWRVLWRSLLLLVGYPAETLTLALCSAFLLALYWKAPVTGLLLGGPLLLSVPCTALEKLLWRYTITFDGMDPEVARARWERESDRGWRELLKPWENR